MPHIVVEKRLWFESDEFIFSHPYTSQTTVLGVTDFIQ
jgi:hypothetical protein